MLRPHRFSLLGRDSQHKPIQCFRDFDLTGKPRPLGIVGIQVCQQLLFIFVAFLKLAKPIGINVAVAGRTGALAAANSLDSHALVAQDLHEDAPFRGFEPVLVSVAVGDVNDSHGYYNLSRNRNFCTLPEAFLGKLSIKLTLLGALKLAICFLDHSISAFSLVSAHVTTKA